MLVLGLQGSPRKGNTDYLLTTFLKEAEKLGARTAVVDATKKNILPCKEYVVCEKKGFCPIDDDMKHDIYPLLREADIIVLASPIFFYNVTAQLKALIDRTQTLWARKYKLKLTDPARNYRRGFVLSLGATRGKNLFEGVHLTAKYFFDAVGASFEGGLTYRRIENKGDMEKHPEVLEDVKKSVSDLLSPLLGRKKVLFACRENACRSQMAAAFTQYLAGDRFEASCAGSEPAEKINADMVKSMQEKGIDMAFRTTRSLGAAISESQPDMIITMGCGEDCPHVQGVQREDWDLPDPAGKPMAFMEEVRDEIEKRVKGLIENVSGSAASE